MLSELTVVIVYHTYTHQIITLCILHLYIICQLYLNKTGGKFYKLQKNNTKKFPSCHLVSTVRTILPTFQSDHVTSVLRTSSGSPSFSEQTPTDHMSLATTSHHFPRCLHPSRLDPLFAQRTKYNAASGSLHLLNPLSGMLCL